MAPRDLPGASSARVLAAWRFADRAHRGTTRRDGVTPYVAHAVAVAREVALAGGSEDLLCAAYLHDVVEHEDVVAAELAAGFGDRVASLVEAVTHEASEGAGPPRGWLEQKRSAIGALRAAGDDVLLLRAADLCANVDDLMAGHAAVGRAVWERYEAGASRQAGYYVALGRELLARMPAGVARERLEERLRSLREVLAADGVRPRGRFGTGAGVAHT
jgi:(p)ppGpp synthase/HD superfamily hydrolase